VPKSGTYAFEIEAGTGAYAQTVGQGKVGLVIGSDTFKVTFHGAPNR
jgi:hypothetical protein